jgi:hypothetical protein
MVMAYIPAAARTAIQIAPAVASVGTAAKEYAPEIRGFVSKFRKDKNNKEQPRQSYKQAYKQASANTNNNNNNGMYWLLGGIIVAGIGAVIYFKVIKK